MSERFDLPSELNIYGVMEARDALLAWVSAQAAEANEYLEVSAGNVEAVDGAGLQLLAALSNMDQPWRLVAASDVFVEACQTMGFAHWLDKRYLSSSDGQERA
jgi:ABC-type transporter Mla MlaB component